VSVAAAVRVVLPAHLRALARAPAEVVVEVELPATLGSLLDALEARYPVLRGTIREHDADRRRPLLRFFACREDLTQAGFAAVLPGPVLAGHEPLLVVGAIAGG
jgi:molybdopterin synthase sulfur carrier subunit